MIARDGWPLIIAFAVISVVIGTAALWLLGPAGWAIVGIGALLTGWCAWFFRDPERTPPDDPLAVVSPADGVVVSIGPAALPPELAGADGRPMQRVCVFMNVFDVHVNRVPIAGTVERLVYTAGKFFNASFDKASIHNERQAVLLRTGDGRSVAFVQIAGLVARRIICRLKEGQSVRAGERFGMIRFGSRVDVYLPADSSVQVALGHKSTAGRTVLARLSVPAAAGSPPAGLQGAALGR